MWIKNYNGDTMIRIDSRKVQENDTFIAIKGYKDDGHNYIEDAIIFFAPFFIASSI